MSGRRRCPVYALRPFTVMGLTYEGIGAIAATVGVFRLIEMMLGWQSGPDIIAAFVMYLIVSWATKGKPPGYLIYLAAHVCGNPIIEAYLPGWRTSMRKIWLDAGLPPPPAVQSRFDV